MKRPLLWTCIILVAWASSALAARPNIATHPPMEERWQTLLGPEMGATATQLDTVWFGGTPAGDGTIVRGGTWTFETLLHAGLVAIAASAFELGHDPFSGPYSRWIYGGLVLMPCVSLGWIPLGLACLVTACSAVALLRFLSSTDRSPTRRFLCAASPYLSVALISATLFSWKG